MGKVLRRLAPLLTAVCLMGIACTVWIANPAAYATGSGAQLIKDTNTTPEDGLSSYFYESFNGVEYFLGYTATAGSELWRTDGTSAGTYMVKDKIGRAHV